MLAVYTIVDGMLFLIMLLHTRYMTAIWTTWQEAEIPIFVIFNRKICD